jgi:EAL domain-containing protein (putative c-di-GMP-specific phosphodiesterase class I)/GAF domain-containing protein
MSDYERNRLFTLRQLNLLDTPPSESFDRITRMASRMFDLPISAVSLTDEDRQWFKSRVGIEEREIPRFKACCSEVTRSSDVVVVPDLSASPAYHDSLLARSGIRFYAGAPLTTRDGYTLGSLCVLGAQPRTVSDDEMAFLRDLAAMVMAQIELHQAVGRIASVTGLPNFDQLIDDLEDEAIQYAGAQRFLLSVELIDDSEAGTIQRVMGPSYVDQLARQAGQVLTDTAGEAARVYHTGRCQFAQVLNGRRESALRCADELRDALAGLTLRETAPLMLNPVVGIAPFQLAELEPHDAVRMASSAAADARSREAAAEFYSPATDAAHQRRFDLLNRFRRALTAADELRLVYQPRLDVSTGHCTGMEALIRWHDPVLGEVAPDEFVPLVERSPMARELTDWVLRRAIEAVAAWYRAATPRRVSVNIAPANLEEGDFSERLFGYLRAAGLPVEAIELELTEGSVVGTGPATRKQLRDLVAAGVNVAIDDFGTGYSSLAYLQDLPANVVKIDRSFVVGVEKDTGKQTLVRSMTAMANELGYRVVAEGVETAAAYRFIASLGDGEAQGEYLASPMAADAIEAWLGERDRALTGAAP